MVKKKTIAAFQDWAGDPDAVDSLLQRIADGVKLRDACLEARMPYTLVYPFLNSDSRLKARFEAARASVAESLMDDRLELREKALSARESHEVMGVKVAAEIMESTAKAWNRERYGEQQAPAVSVNINVADVTREIRELEARLGIGVAAPVEVAALPSPDAQDAEFEMTKTKRRTHAAGEILE